MASGILMCGISGCVLRVGDREPPAPLVAVVEYQNRRGPDSPGYISRALGDGRTLWLAHNRLSIVDLSSDSHQPMVSQGERQWEERRDGNGGVSRCRSRGPTEQYNKKKQTREE